MRTILAILLAAMMLAVPLALAKEGHDDADDDDDAKDKSGRGGHDGNKTRDRDNETDDDNETEDESDDADDDSNKTKDRANKTRGGDKNETDDEDDDNETSGHGKGKDRLNKTERLAARQARAEAFDSLIDRLHALRASWLENATAIRAQCHAIETGENATENTTRAHCIRDGYKAWREANRAEIDQLRDDLKALTKGGRGDSD